METNVVFPVQKPRNPSPEWPSVFIAPMTSLDPAGTPGPEVAQEGVINERPGPTGIYLNRDYK